MCHNCLGADGLTVMLEIMRRFILKLFNGETRMGMDRCSAHVWRVGIRT